MGDRAAPAKKDGRGYPSVLTYLQRTRKHSCRGVVFVTNMFVPKHDQFAPVKLSLASLGLVERRDCLQADRQAGKQKRVVRGKQKQVERQPASKAARQQGRRAARQARQVRQVRQARRAKLVRLGKPDKPDEAALNDLRLHSSSESDSSLLGCLATSVSQGTRQARATHHWARFLLY